MQSNYILAILVVSLYPLSFHLSPNESLILPALQSGIMSRFCQDTGILLISRLRRQADRIWYNEETFRAGHEWQLFPTIQPAVICISNNTQHNLLFYAKISQEEDVWSTSRLDLAVLQSLHNDGLGNSCIWPCKEEEEEEGNLNPTLDRPVYITHVFEEYFNEI